MLGTLFAFAIIGGYLKAAVVLCERSWRLVNPVFHSGNPGFVHTRCLKDHIKNVADLTPSISPLQAACQRGNEDVLEAILYLLVKVIGVNVPVSGVQSLKHTFTKLLFYIARSGSKEMLDLVIGHGFNIEAAMKLKVDEVQQLLLDEDSHENAQDKTLFNGDTLIKNILIASDGHYMTLENNAQWSDNKELFDYLVDLQLKQDVVSSGNNPKSLGYDPSQSSCIRKSLQVKEKHMHRESCPALKQDQLCWLVTSAVGMSITSHSRKKKEMVSFLLKKGADPNYTSNGGYTSMDIASGLQTKGSRELVKLLLQAGFNMGKKNHWGEDYSNMVTRM